MSNSDSNPKPFELQLLEERLRNDNMAFALSNGLLSVQEAMLVMSVPGYRPARISQITAPPISEPLSFEIEAFEFDSRIMGGER